MPDYLETLQKYTKSLKQHRNRLLWKCWVWCNKYCAKDLYFKDSTCTLSLFSFEPYISTTLIYYLKRRITRPCVILNYIRQVRLRDTWAYCALRSSSYGTTSLWPRVRHTNLPTSMSWVDRSAQVLRCGTWIQHSKPYTCQDSHVEVTSLVLSPIAACSTFFFGVAWCR